MSVRKKPWSDRSVAPAGVYLDECVLYSGLADKIRCLFACDVRTPGQAGLAGKDDSYVVDYLVSTGFLIVTHNGDHFRRAFASCGGVVNISEAQSSYRDRVKLILQVLRLGPELLRRSFVAASEDRIVLTGSNGSARVFEKGRSGRFRPA